MNNKFAKFVPYICFLGCIIFIITGCMNFKKQKTYPTTTAVIKDITVDDTVTDRSGYIVHVEYTVEGESHEAILDTYSSNMRIGDEVSVLYDLTNPAQVSKAGMMSVYIQFGFSLVCIAAGVISLKQQRESEQ